MEKRWYRYGKGKMIKKVLFIILLFALPANAYVYNDLDPNHSGLSLGDVNDSDHWWRAAIERIWSLTDNGFIKATDSNGVLVVDTNNFLLAAHDACEVTAAKIAIWDDTASDYDANQPIWTDLKSDYDVNELIWSDLKSDYDANELIWTDLKADYDANQPIWDATTTDFDANCADWDTAYTHVSNNGTDHSYIDQDLQTTASPSFAAVSLGTGELTCGSINRGDTSNLTIESNGSPVITITNTPSASCSGLFSASRFRGSSAGASTPTFASTIDTDTGVEIPSGLDPNKVNLVTAGSIALIVDGNNNTTVEGTLFVPDVNIADMDFTFLTDIQWLETKLQYKNRVMTNGVLAAESGWVDVPTN